MQIIITKTFDLNPFPCKGISWTKRKNKIYVGDITFHNLPHQVWHVTKEQAKQLIKMMVQAKTDMLTDGEYFYTVIDNKHLVRIEHPELVL